MQKCVKAAAAAIMVVLLLNAFLLPILAAEQLPDVTKTDCSIMLSYRDKDGNPIQGGGFTLYYVASIRVYGRVVRYDTYGTDFAKSGIEIVNPEDTELAQQLAVYAEKNSLQGTTRKLDENGELRFENLNVGIYLIVQTRSIPGYYSVRPFLVSVPASDENNDDWVYDVNASLKSELKPYTTGTTKPNGGESSVGITVFTARKEWSDNGENRPKAVTVQLLRGDAVYDEIILSEENNWTFTWTWLDDAYTWSVREVNIPDGYSASYSTSGTETVITNTSTLIQTGQLNWPVPLLAESGIILFAVGWVLIFIKKEKTNGEA